MDTLQSLAVSVDAEAGVGYVLLNRPRQRNAIDWRFVQELPAAMAAMDENQSVRAVIIAGAGHHFCAGIDLSFLDSMINNNSTTNDTNNAEKAAADSSSSSSTAAIEQGREREALRRRIKHMQAAVNAVEACRKPVLAAVHGACIGGAIDLICACDIRYCTDDAVFAVKEVDFAITADLGTLQRLPRLVGHGRASELALTCRRFSASEAKEIGLVQGVFQNRAEMQKQVLAIASGIAQKSPLAVTGTKAVLLRSRDVPVEQGLDYVATWNAATLLSADLKEALAAQLEQRKPRFAKL